MSDTRDQLAEILHKQGAYCGTCDYESRDCPDCTKVLEGYADAILAEFLVIPRTDIVDTEYGIRQYRGDRASWLVERALSRDGAIAAAKREHYDDDFEDRPHAQAVERPVLPSLPWSPIPLPEDGKQQ